MDQVCDTYNMAHGCEVANEAEKDIGIHRASGFNELFEAVLKKECDAGELAARSGSGGEQQQDSEGKQQQDSESGSDKQQFGPEVEGLKKLIKKLVMEAGGMASSKWTWGVDLTEDDLRSLIRGADRQHQVPHSGYDQDLSSGALRSQTSEALDPVNLEDPKDGNLRFDDVSISTIPDLGPHEFPRFSVVLDPSEDQLGESEPDPVIEAFTRRAKTQAIKAKKLMQDEVDQPASFVDYGSEFVPRTALIPCRPWLAPRLPIILPPTNRHFHVTATNPVVRTELDADDEFPDHIIMPESNDTPDDIDIADSDGIPDHLILPDSDSSHSGQIHFPLSDDEMDGVSDEPSAQPNAESDTEIPMSVANTDSESDSNIILPRDTAESPMATWRVIGGLGAFTRDPNTGRFTPASFSIFSDQVLDESCNIRCTCIMRISRISSES